MQFDIILKIYIFLDIILFILENIYIYKFFKTKEKNDIKLEKIMLNVSNILISVYAAFKAYVLFYDLYPSINFVDFLVSFSQFLFSILIAMKVIFGIIFLKYMKKYKIMKILFFVVLLQIIFSIGVFIAYYFMLRIMNV